MRVLFLYTRTKTPHHASNGGVVFFYVCFFLACERGGGRRSALTVFAHEAAGFGDEHVGSAPLPLGVVVGKELTDIRETERARDVEGLGGFSHAVRHVDFHLKNTPRLTLRFSGVAFSHGGVVTALA